MAGEYVIGMNVSDSVSNTSQEIDKRGEEAYRYYEFDDPAYRDELVSIEKIVAAPETVTPAKPGYKLVSLAVRGNTPESDSDSKGSMIKYYPPGYKLIDSKGEEHKVKAFTVEERGGWEHNSWLRIPSTSLIILTYEVPEDSNRAALIVNGDLVTAEYVIAFDMD